MQNQNQDQEEESQVVNDLNALTAQEAYARLCETSLLVLMERCANIFKRDDN